MAARGLNLADRALCQTMQDRVGASLRGMRGRGMRGMRGRGRVAGGEGKGPGVRWQLA